MNDLYTCWHMIHNLQTNKNLFYFTNSPVIMSCTTFKHHFVGKPFLKTCLVLVLKIVACIIWKFPALWPITRLFTTSKQQMNCLLSNKKVSLYK